MCSSRLAFGRIALVGDAAVVARPHVGAGTTKAMQDAAALAGSLGRTRDVPAALQDYERARLEPGQRLYERSRWLGTHLAPGSKEGGRDQAAETLLGHTALPSV
ncbi:MAG: FAD-dependent monooxygenase [Pseudomonadota bacterium]|nr:FAD-dependent monooxygenase [Pseudomonadota bacterium]